MIRVVLYQRPKIYDTTTTVGGSGKNYHRRSDSYNLSNIRRFTTALQITFCCVFTHGFIYWLIRFQFLCQLVSQEVTNLRVRYTADDWAGILKSMIGTIIDSSDTTTRQQENDNKKIPNTNLQFPDSGGFHS